MEKETIEREEFEEIMGIGAKSVKNKEKAAKLKNQKEILHPKSSVVDLKKKAARLSKEDTPAILRKKKSSRP